MFLYTHACAVSYDSRLKNKKVSCIVALLAEYSLLMQVYIEQVVNFNVKVRVFLFQVCNSLQQVSHFLLQVSAYRIWIAQ